MLLTTVEVKNSLHKMLEKHTRVLCQEQMREAELSYTQEGKDKEQLATHTVCIWYNMYIPNQCLANITAHYNRRMLTLGQCSHNASRVASVNIPPTQCTALHLTKSINISANHPLFIIWPTHNVANPSHPKSCTHHIFAIQRPRPQV